MGRHWEKQVERARAAVAAVGQRPEPQGPMSSEEIESYLKGFGLSSANARQITRKWVEDQSRANEQGYEAAQDDMEWQNS